MWIVGTPFAAPVDYLFLALFILADEPLVLQYFNVLASTCFALQHPPELLLVQSQLLADVVGQTSFQFSPPMGYLCPEHKSLCAIEEGESVSALTGVHAEFFTGAPWPQVSLGECLVPEPGIATCGPSRSDRPDAVPANKSSEQPSRRTHVRHTVGRLSHSSCSYLPDGRHGSSTRSSRTHPSSPSTLGALSGKLGCPVRMQS